MNKLYDVCKEVDEIIRESNEDDLSESLDFLTIPKEQKAKNIAWGVKNLQAELDAFQKEAARIKEIIRVKKNKLEGMSGYLSGLVTKEETDKFSMDPTVEFKWRKSTAVVLKVDPEFLPSHYRHEETVYKADKTLLKKALMMSSKAGIDASGLVSYAELEERQNLTIK